MNYQIVFKYNFCFKRSHMYPENLEGTRVIIGSMNMGYDSDIPVSDTVLEIELSTCFITNASLFL